MARYIDEKDVYKLVEPNGTAIVHCSQIDELPRADVAPKNDVAREIFEEIEREIRSSVEVIIIIKDEEEDGWYDGELNMLGMFGRYIAELKKKYTEERK